MDAEATHIAESAAILVCIDENFTFAPIALARSGPNGRPAKISNDVTSLTGN
jgi:hypothetical protein